MEDIYPIENEDRLEFTPEGDALIEALIGETKMDSLTQQVFDVLNDGREDVTFSIVEMAIEDLNDVEVGELEIALAEGDYDTIESLIID